MEHTSFHGVGTMWPILLILVYLGLAGLGIYCLILFIKLARRGIQAFNLYLQEKSDKRG